MGQMLLAYVFLLLIFMERIRNTFSNSKYYNVEKTAKEVLLCSLMTALYITILLISFAAVHSRGYTFNISISLIGLFVWLVGLGYRRAAIRSLGRNWSIYRPPLNRLRSIITLGTFGNSRHPYYTASLVELLGYALMFNSLLGGVLTICVYLPLILLRIKAEEQFLLKSHKNEYEDYMKIVPIMINPVSLLLNQKLLKTIGQIVTTSRKYGVKHIFRILRMNKAVTRYFRNYMMSQCVCALSKTAVLEMLMVDGEIDIQTIAKEKNFDFRTLRIICDYLYVTRFLSKRAFRYSLTDYGRKLMMDSRGVFDFIYAYAPIFENLDGLISKQKKYEVDFHRRGEFVGRASAELAELFPFPVARALLAKYKLKRLLDLGSGSGDFLIGFCRDGDFRGCGVDLSPEAVAYAKKKATENNVEDRANFIVGDILRLKDYVDSSMDIDVVTSMFVLHEFLSKSEQFVLDIFESIKVAFPDKYILICELTKCSLDRLYRSPSGVAEHHLFHSLSEQGLATSEQWRALFEKAGLDLIIEERLDLAEQSIFLLKPKR